ncbi:MULTISPECIES: hypothetical protein [Alistipes]|uniref:hypothetical protein n=1 Tax=Alistipes TaxID=239759 RepID=UPI001F588225|nr:MULTISPECIES: hypothetical protein [Alistipes]MCI2258898.1 hypothetical protein [Alistipes dispar]
MRRTTNLFMRGYGRNIGAALLLTLFAGYWSCITLFPHAHDVNGHVIVHSHPFSGASNGAAQTHTPQQFQLIAHLSLLVMTAAWSLTFALRLSGVRFVYPEREPVSRPRLPLRTFGLRAPPAH